MEPKPCWVLKDGTEYPGFVIFWRQLEDGSWRATVRYTIDMLQYQHSVNADEVRPRED